MIAVIAGAGIATLVAACVGLRLLGHACQPTYWSAGSFPPPPAQLEAASHDPHGGGHG